MLDRISLILVIIGALNWGSIGLFKFDIVSWICGHRAYYLHTCRTRGNMVHLAPVQTARKRIQRDLILYPKQYGFALRFLGS